MSIVAIVGSPRLNGNTNYLVDQALGIAGIDKMLCPKTLTLGGFNRPHCLSRSMNLINGGLEMNFTTPLQVGICHAALKAQRRSSHK